MSQPLISIVMPSYNQVEFIEASIKSVLDQDYENIELIVQDGRSTDGTIACLERMSVQDSRLQWVSQEDCGPADALNRAFNKVRGEIIGWLNSDDLFMESAVSTIVEAFSMTPNWLMCYGQGLHIDVAGNEIGAYPTRRPDVGLRGFEAGCFICQPTVFFKASVTTLLGPLNVRLKTAFDYDYWLQAFRAFPDRIGFVDEVLAKSRLHEACITQRLRRTVALEGLELGHKHLGRASPHWAVTFLEELRRTHLEEPGAFEQEAAAFIVEASPFLSDHDTARLTSAIRVQSSGGQQ